jgi:hypothetical protein
MTQNSLSTRRTRVRNLTLPCRVSLMPGAPSEEPPFGFTLVGTATPYGESSAVSPVASVGKSSSCALDSPLRGSAVALGGNHARFLCRETLWVCVAPPMPAARLRLSGLVARQSPGSGGTQSSRHNGGNPNALRVRQSPTEGDPLRSCHNAGNPRKALLSAALVSPDACDGKPVYVLRTRYAISTGSARRCSPHGAGSTTRLTRRQNKREGNPPAVLAPQGTSLCRTGSPRPFGENLRFRCANASHLCRETLLQCWTHRAASPERTGSPY